MQIGLIGFTIGGYLLVSLKMPQYGVILSLISQFFRLYSSYRSRKEADQIGVFITTIFMTLVISYGVLNYWVL